MTDAITIGNFKLSKPSFDAVWAIFFLSIFIFASFFIPFNLYLYIFALTFAAIFIFRSPEAGLYAILVLTFIFERYFTLIPIEVGDNLYKFYPLDAVIVITLLAYFFQQARVGPTRPKIRITPIGVAIIIFFLAGLVASVWGLSQGGDFDFTFSTLKNYCLYSIVFFLFINVIRAPTQINRFTKAILITGAALLFFVFYGLINRAGLWIEFTPLSTSGIRLLAPTHGFYLCITILFTLNLYAYGRKYFRALTIPIVLAQVLGVVGALTRHLWLALFVGIIFCFFLIPKKYRWDLARVLAIQLLFIAILATVYFWFDYVITGKFEIPILDFLRDLSQRFYSFTFFYQDPSAAYRLLSWEKAWDLFKTNPFLGIGFGQKITFDFFGYPVKVEIRELHNNYIGIALQMGLMGLLSFLAIIILYFREFFRRWKSTPLILQPILLSAVGGCLMFLFSAAFGVYLDINLLLVPFWLLVGLSVSIYSLTKIYPKSSKK